MLKNNYSFVCVCFFSLLLFKCEMLNSLSHGLVAYLPGLCTHDDSSFVFLLQVPTLSQWFHDMSPFYFCCLWQDEQAVGCETYRFERRPTQDCVAYQPPYVGERSLHTTPVVSTSYCTINGNSILQRQR